jgi:hypothetical protein
VARLALLLVAACTNHGESVGRATLVSGLRTSGGFDGVHASANAGFNGFQLGLGAFTDQLARPLDPGRHTAGGVEMLARFSLFGMFADDHRLEHWFDIGVEGAAGGGFAHPAALEGFGELWSGVFVDIGLAPGPSYPALSLGVRALTLSSPWNGETIATIGLSWVSRTIEPFWFPM